MSDHGHYFEVMVCRTDGNTERHVFLDGRPAMRIELRDGVWHIKDRQDVSDTPDA